MMQQMVEYRRLAAHARCRIKAWKVTEEEAFDLARECIWAYQPFTILEIVEMMKAGIVRLLGAKVVVKS